MAVRSNLDSRVRSFCLPALVAASFTTWCGQAFATTQLLAVTGDAQPGAAGAQLEGIAGAALNASGQVVVQATLREGVGGVTAGDRDAVWRIDSSGKSSLARTGVGSVPGLVADPFATLPSMSIDDAGAIALLATVQSAKQGVWRFPAIGAGSLTAITNVSAVPGVANGKYLALGPELFQSTAGAVAIDGRMQIGPGGVGSTNDRGIWLYDSSSSALVSREGVSSVPDLPAASKFAVPSAAGVNHAGETVAFGTLQTGEGITSDNNFGLWRLVPGGGILLAWQQSSSVGGVPNAMFANFLNPTINGEGHVAFDGELAATAGVTAATSHGIWRFEGTGTLSIARSGVGGVPGAEGADFNSLGAPLLNNAGQIAFRATLAVGVGGVTAENSVGLWMADEIGSSLVARAASGGVPGVAAASFADFGTMALNQSGVIAVRGTLAAGVGGVSASNDVGLWLLNGSGSGVLVAREGGTLAGRTVADLDFTGGSGGDDGHARALNDSGQFLFKATFTNGDQGLFLYSPASSADFNSDGVVSGADLSRWKTGFGTGSAAVVGQGDADRDGDVDGADFLAWQRQLSAVGGAVTPTPEPASAILLLVAALAGRLKFSRGACPVRRR